MKVLSWCARQFLWLKGWKIIGEFPPEVKKAVLVFGPHTSNWDACYGFATIFAKQVPVKFAIKKEAMFFPLGPILKALGAIPIDRKKRNLKTKSTTMVDEMVNILQQAASLMLVISPEGTRSYAKRWKTGFYRIATQAQVPILLGYLDYAQKQTGIGPIFYPTGNLEEDLPKIQAFYKDKTGKYPAHGVR